MNPQNPQNPYTIGFSPYATTQTQSGGNTGNTGFFGGGYSPYSQMNLLPTIPISGGPQGGFFGLPALPIRRPPNPMVPPQDQPAPPPEMGTPRIDPIFPDYRAINPTQPATPPRGEVYTPPPLPDLSNYPPQVREAIELERQRDLGLAPRPTPPTGLPDISDTLVEMPTFDNTAPPVAPMTAQQILQMAVGKIPADLRYDANGDGRITSSDALAFHKTDPYAQGMMPPYQSPVVEQPPRLSAQEQAQEILKMAVRRIPADMQYDLNGDGRITSADALAYLKQNLNRG